MLTSEYKGRTLRSDSKGPTFVCCLPHTLPPKGFHTKTHPLYNRMGFSNVSYWQAIQILASSAAGSSMRLGTPCVPASGKSFNFVSSGIVRILYLA